ncbi:MAG: endonuclease MutS2 [Ardenticatenaceae bacterium]|nr:endonuclease MutS2 [Ardenticatenaceae bacterium]
MDLKSSQILEFDKVKKRLAEYTNFSASEALALHLMPTTDEREAIRWQAEVTEAVLLFESSSDITIGGARDVRPAADRATRGITLLPEDLLQVRDTIVAARELRRKLERAKERVPHLQAIAELIEECPGVVAAVGRTLDERGEVLDSASTKLADIRRQLRVTHGRIQDKLRGVLNSHGVYLQEAIISQRNGRYVVPVRAESKGNVRGIVHDTSGSGATFWVEPMATVELNNTYRELQIDEDREIQRLLQELSQMVADLSDEIIRVVDRLAEIDLILAKAKYAGVIRGIAPVFIDWKSMPVGNPHPGSTLWFKGARHPLLEPETVIPTDLTVPEDVFLVLITGPNTGGKTVSLKTLGLMVMMAQSGLRLPCREARLSFFDNVLADIGDEQSIEQNLSTFSAHMSNIIHILERADDRSLVLLDELGSGTDPAEGAALAMSIIDYLRDLGATVFTATHYPELKAYATHTAGATNASLLFDLDTLSPTFEMTIGIPGKSNALAIARRLGLEETIIDGAMGKLGHGNSETEELLESIYDMREKIASEEAAARLARRRSEREREKLGKRLLDIEDEREKILQEARGQVEEELSAIRREIRQVRQQLKGAESRSLLKRLNKEVDIIEERPLSSVTDTPLIDSVMPKESRAQKRRKLRVGDEVFIKTINAKGEILTLNKGDAEIAVGRLHMRASLDELEFRGRPVQQEESISVPKAGGKTDMELDLRGERVESGLEKLDKYLDGAALSRLPWVRIIHGKGTGRLRDAVRKALTKHKAVTSWEEGKDGEGGAGVTVARLEEES